MAVVGIIGFGASQAFFTDEETSVGNVFTAGKIDMKIDHVMASYNGKECHTCSVVLISDETNMVVEKNGVEIESPYPAVFLSFIHPAWTAQNDPSLDEAGAEWIWESDPVKQEDTTTDVTYTFRKTFNWFGPITGSDFSMAVGHDNTVEVYLNDVLVGSSNDIYGFRIENMLHIPAGIITSNVVQGENVLDIELTNKGQTNGNPSNNPAGLIYKFEIDGQCEGDDYLSSCNLWQEKDLETGDIFWDLQDVKPGDYGRNVISMHVYNNDYWACMLSKKTDLENNLTGPEIEAGDTTSDEGELSKYIDVFIWNDLDHDGVYEPGSHEDAIYSNGFPDAISLREPDDAPLLACTTYYYGVAWCVGTQSIDDDTGEIVCSGEGDHNDAQTDTLTVDLKFFAEQSRNNDDFSCGGVNGNNDVAPTSTQPTPTEEPNEEPQLLSVEFTDMGAVTQYGYVHDYSGADVTFEYQSPANPKLSGTITATGLKPYATYQLKFEAKPTCAGSGGDDELNEVIGLRGRWWDNTAGSNLNSDPATNDTFYYANSTYYSGTHCITGYLVWDYITADENGDVTKSVSTQNSYHVLWCNGGLCDSVSNSNLTTGIDPAHPSMYLCNASDVGGENERFGCDGLSLPSRTYDLRMILNEESFHQGNWTAVMDTTISFELL